MQHSSIAGSRFARFFGLGRKKSILSPKTQPQEETVDEEGDAQSDQSVSGSGEEEEEPEIGMLQYSPFAIICPLFSMACESLVCLPY